MEPKKKSTESGHSSSLRAKIVRTNLLMIIPVMLILIACNMLCGAMFKRQLSADSRQVIEPYAKEIETTMKNARLYILKLIGNAAFFQKCVTSIETGDGPERRSTLTTLGNTLASDLTGYPEIDAVFLYSGSDIRFVVNSYREYSEEAFVSEAVAARISAFSADENLYAKDFQTLLVDGKYYFLIASNQSNGVTLGCWISSDSLLSTFSDGKGGSPLKYLRMSDKAGRILDPGLDSGYTVSSNKNISNFITVERPLENSDYCLVGLMDKHEVFRPLEQIEWMNFTIVVLVALFILSMTIYYRKIIIRPLDRLVETIDSVIVGRLEHIPETPEAEFELQKVNDALNLLISEIEELKVKIYKEKLEKKEAELQLVQLQVKPHFFLNSLNTILSFGRSGNYEMVQRMTLCLSEHFRYILYKNSLISIGEEISHTKNYLEIQSMRYDRQCSYSTNVDETLLDESIPILLLQTFVENSFKHSGAQVRALAISIQIRRVEVSGNDRISISVDDIGEGIDDETLTLLNNGGQKIVNEHKSIGIYNMRQRLTMIYSDNFTLNFSANTFGGAHVEMTIPFTVPGEVLSDEE